MSETEEDDQTTATICRICLKRSNEKGFVSIYEAFRDTTILEHICMITVLHVVPNDGLPTQICDPCLVDLETAVDFKMRCERSDLYLRSTLLETKSEYQIEIKKEEPLSEDEEYREGEQQVELSKFEGDYDNLNESPEEYKDVEQEEDIPQVEQEVVQCASGAVMCHDCGGVFKSKCKLRVHWKKEHKPILMCEICKRVFKAPSAYLKHVKKKARTCLVAKYANIEGTGKTRLLSCKNCNYKTNINAVFINHVNIHTGVKPYSCNLCTSSFTQLSALMGHKENVHKIFKVEITCNFCGKLVKGRQNAYRHLKQHSTYRYQCDICKIFVKARSSIITHLKIHSSTKPYTCEICAESFRSVSNLCNHKRVKHCPPVYYNCEFCPYKAKRKEIVQKHQLKHNDSEALFCPVCGMYFESNHKLQIHMNLHASKDHMYCCPFCPKPFVTRNGLNKHVRKNHESVTAKDTGMQVVSDKSNKIKVKKGKFKNRKDSSKVGN